MNEHEPVLFQEVLLYLQPRPDGKYIDGTVGAAGHLTGLIERAAPGGSFLGLDRDADAIAYCRRKLAAFGENVVLVQASYADVDQIASQHGFSEVDGILLDLGLSSRQLATSARGFSFQQDGPLDMRFDTTQGLTAAELLNTLDEAALSELLWRYGEVRESRKVARAIIESRPISTTGQLAGIAEDSAASRRSRKTARRIHPATRIFQALRIAVNDELVALEKALPAMVGLLRPGGRLAIISFHSLEDRIVKQFIREQSLECVCPPRQPICTCDTQPTLKPVTRKVIKPTAEEIARNPRSRSARLRVAEKLMESV